MSLSSGLKFWGIVSLIFIAFFWIFHASLLPFIIGLIIAYILNPAVDWLENKGVHRLIATNVTLLSFVVLFVLFFWLFVPIVSDQIATFIENLPHYQKKAAGYIGDFLGKRWQEDLLGKDIDYQKYVSEYAKSALGVTGNVINKVFVNLVALFKNVTFLIIVPVVAFYFLLDWHILLAKIDSWLPRKHALTIRRLISNMDNLQSGFIRGQVIVCVIQAFFYITVLSVIGLDYSITLGFVSGVLTFIPYIGAGIGFLMVLMVALVQYLPDYYPIILVCCAFGVGQVLEGYVWVPQIVGSSVSLHPLWIMFSLLAFGSILGLSGMLIAVPVTAAIGVLTRYALENYIQSPYYYANDSIHD
ncbi:MAG: putative PurR-regulated permease PerM [Alphaproteobacteria bacterium]|jgi:predicted PurR-regulated permease PerM